MACFGREYDLGRFQWLIVILYGWCAQPWCASKVSIIFITPHVQHWCQDLSPSFLNLSLHQQKILMADSCTRPDVDFAQYTSNELVAMNFSEYNRTSCEDGYVFENDLFDWTLTEKMDLVCERAWLRNMINTVYMFGYFISAVMCGILGDRFGRRPVLLCSDLLGTLAHLACALVPTVHLFIVCRFFGALCDMGVCVSGYVIAMELLEPRHRKLPATSVALLNSVCLSLLGVLVMVVRRYDHLLFIISGWYFSSFLIHYFVFPESPRWLAARHKTDELNRIAERISKMNNNQTNGADVLEALNLETKGGEGKERTHSNIFDLFRTPLLLKRTMVLCVIWFTFVCVWYALMFSLEDFGPDIRLTLIIGSLLDIPGLIFITMTIERLGRQVIGFSCLLLSGICCLAMSPIVHQSDSYYLMTLALLGKFFASMLSVVLYLLTPELYPTVCRTTGLGLSSTVARVAGMLAPQLSLVNKVWPPFLVVTLGVCGLVSAALIPILPDTTGRELPQSLDQGEKFCFNHRYGLVLPRRRNTTLRRVEEENQDCEL